MGEEISPTVIKKTQDTLGKFVKRPPLTEKLLRKPPFRFLHDIVTTVIRETKFLDGLFSDEEMNSENVKDKESKIAFLKKVIDVVNLACGISLTVRPTKIVSGYEPEKTNELLQAIGKAIDKKVDSTAAVEKVLSKYKPKGSVNVERSSVKKSQSKEELKDPPKVKKVTGAVKKVTKEQSGSTQNLAKTVSKIEVKDKRTAAVSKATRDKKNRLETHAKEESTPRDNALKEKRRSIDVRKNEDKTRKSDGKEKNVADTSTLKKEVPAQERNSIIKRGESKEEDPNRKDLNKEQEQVAERMLRRNTVDLTEEVEDAFLSLEPPVSERDIVQGGESAKTSLEVNAKVEDSEKPESAKKKNPVSNTVRSEETRTPVSSGHRVAISTPVLRPASVMAGSASRPRSSRPHAPRLKSALGGRILAENLPQKAEEQTKETAAELGAGVPVAGGDRTMDDVDEKEFLVEEARPISPTLASKETKQQFGERNDLSSLEGEKQGVLVAKILETKKELEAGVEEKDSAEGVPLKRVEIEYEEDELRKRRKGTGDTENLRALVQSIARSAHPLGSLLGMMQGNVEAMRSEAQKWRNESEKLMKQLREEEKNMEQDLEPLRSILSEVEQRVVEEREALSAAKVRVLNAEQRIRLMLDPQGSGISQAASSYRI